MRFPLFYIAQNEFKGTVYNCPNNEGAIPIPSASGIQYQCPITSGSDLMDLFSIVPDNAAGYFVGTICVSLTFRLLSILALRFVNHVKR